MEDRIDQLERELLDLKIELASFTSGVREWMSTTTEYRKTLCMKLDIMGSKIVDLPCRERKSIYESLITQIRFMWAIMSAMLALVISKFFNQG